VWQLTTIQNSGGVVMSKFSDMPKVAPCAQFALVAIFLAVFCLSTSHAQAANRHRIPQAPLNLGTTQYVVRGPYSHKNMSVYLIHGKAKRLANENFLTLDIGLATGRVLIREHRSASVGSVLVYNGSNRPLYLQEGERISGGRQDRIFVMPVVIAPRTGPVIVPCMCIERSRWSGRHAFRSARGQLLAPRRVRMTANLSIDQNSVWSQVTSTKADYAKRFRTLNSNSNLNEALESRAVANAILPYINGLNDAKREIATALGMGVAIDGKIEEINMWTNGTLMKQMYPKLVATYAMEAVATGKHKADSPAAADIASMLGQLGKRKRVDAINQDNQVEIRSTGKSVISRTYFRGYAIRLQWVPLDKGMKISERARTPLDGSKAPAFPKNLNDELSPGPAVQSQSQEGNYDIKPMSAGPGSSSPSR